MENSRQFVESISRGFGLLSIVCKSETPLGLSELSKQSNLTVSTIQRLSYTLQQLGLLERDSETKKFRIGPQMITLAMAVMTNLDLKKIARPFMEELASEINEVVALFIVSGNQIILIESIMSDQLLNINLNPGAIIPPHATATGKAILSILPPAQAELMLNKSGMDKFTPKTLTSYKSLMQQVEDVRACGYAVAVDENAIGLSAISAPIRTGSSDVVAALTVMVPSFRGKKEKLIKSFSRKVVQTAARISYALGSEEAASIRR